MRLPTALRRLRAQSLKGLQRLPVKSLLSRIRPKKEERKKRPHHKNLKLAFFTDTYLPNVDGVVSAILSFREELEKRGHEVQIFTSGSLEDKSDNADEKAHYFVSVPFPPYPQYKIALFPFGATGIVQKNNLELIHSHAVASMGFAAIAAAKELGLPLVGTFHTLVPKAGHYITRQPISNLLFTRIAWKAVEQYYKPFDVVTTPTKTVEKLLNENGVNNTAVVPNGVDVKRFSPKVKGQLVREMLGISEKEHVFLCVGRMSEEKNTDVVVKAFSEVLKEEPHSRLVIQGDGPAKRSLVELTKKLGLEKKVILTGFVKSFEVPFFYAAADCFVTASTFETQGLALLEALSCGKVCIGANSLAIPEVVKNGKNGFLFEPGSVSDCREQMLSEISLSSARRRKMQLNARETALNYSIEKCTDSLLKVYEKVL